MQLTAYALGELDARETEIIAARLAASAADRRFVEEVRAAAEAIADGLAREETIGLEAIHYAAIELRLRRTGGPPRVDPRAVVRGRVGLALSLAAAVAIVCGVISAVLFTLFRHPAVAVNGRSAQALHGQVFIPLETLPRDPTPAGAGLAAAGGEADPFVNVADHPVSSFAINTDTASYDDLRQALFKGQLPARDSVRIEGLVNAFVYDAPSRAPGALFGAGIEIAQCPWAPAHRLARIQLKARPGAGMVAEAGRTEVAFNPATARSYRLLGSEPGAASNRAPAGERVPAGHAVTALYEIVPVAPVGASLDFLTLRVRFRTATDGPEQTIQFTGRDADPRSGAASDDFRFAAAVAEFALVLREEPGRGGANMDAVIALADSGRGADRTGERKRFIELAGRAKALLG